MEGEMNYRLFACAQETACRLLLNGKFHKYDLARSLEITVKKLDAFLYCTQPSKIEAKLYARLLKIKKNNQFIDCVAMLGNTRRNSD